MSIPVIKSILVTLAVFLPVVLFVAALVRYSFHDFMLDLGFSEKECAEWSGSPIL